MKYCYIHQYLYREIMRQMLRIELSEDEENLLKSAINGIYGPNTNGVLDKNNFVNFLSRSKKNKLIF